MNRTDRTALMITVDDAVRQYGRGWVEDRITDAHLGRPDGRLVTDENLHLFRQYRNTVSADPRVLTDEALDDCWACGNMAPFCTCEGAS